MTGNFARCAAFKSTDALLHRCQAFCYAPSHNCLLQTFDVREQSSVLCNASSALSIIRRVWGTAAVFSKHHAPLAHSRCLLTGGVARHMQMLYLVLVGKTSATPTAGGVSSTQTRMLISSMTGMLTSTRRLIGPLGNTQWKLRPTWSVELPFLSTSKVSP